MHAHSGLGFAQVPVTLPEPGTIVEGHAGDENIQFYCRVVLDGNKQATTWSLQREDDRVPRAITQDQANLFMTGDPIPGFDQFTFSTNLTIAVLTLHLHNSLIFCGTQGDLHSVNFTILVYGQLSY